MTLYRIESVPFTVHGLDEGEGSTNKDKNESSFIQSII